MPLLKNNLDEFDRAELLSMIEYLQSNLRRRTEQLHRARTSVSGLKNRLNRMKTILANQRQRILELHHTPQHASVDADAALRTRDE